MNRIHKHLLYEGHFQGLQMPVGWWVTSGACVHHSRVVNVIILPWSEATTPSLVSSCHYTHHWWKHQYNPLSWSIWPQIYTTWWEKPRSLLTSCVSQAEQVDVKGRQHLLNARHNMRSNSHRSSTSCIQFYTCNCNKDLSKLLYSLTYKLGFAI